MRRTAVERPRLHPLKQLEDAPTRTPAEPELHRQRDAIVVGELVNFVGGDAQERDLPPEN